MADNALKFVLTADDKTAAAFTSAQGAMKGLNQSAASLKGALATLGVGLSAGAFVGMIKGSIDAADHLNDLHKTTGASVEQLSGLSLAAKQSGVELETVARGMLKFSGLVLDAGNGSREAESKIKALGLNLKDLKSQSPEQQFIALAGALEKFGDEKKGVILADLLGVKMAGLTPLLADGAAGLRKMIADGQGASKVTTEMAEQADKLNDQLALLKQYSGQVSTTLAGEMLPGLISTSEAMIKLQKEGHGVLALLRGFAGLGKIPLDIMFPDQGASTASRIKELNQELADMQRHLPDVEQGGALQKWLYGTKDELQNKIEVTKNQIAALEKFGDKLDKKKPDEKPKTDAEYNPDKSGDDIQKKQDDFLAKAQVAAEYLGQVSKYEEEMRKAEEFAATALGKASDEAKVAFLNKASRINEKFLDFEAGQNAAKRNNAEFDEMDASINKANDAVEALIKSRREANAELEFELSIIGMNNDARAIAIALHEDEKRAVIALAEANKIVDADARAAAVENVNRAKAESDAHTELMRKKTEQEKTWATGASNAFNTYIENATNAAKQSEALFSHAFQGMEDALVAFVKTGKLDFKSLADSILSDMIRINIQNSIMKPLANAVSGFDFMSAAASFFGGGKATGGPVESGMTYLVGEQGPELLHMGGSGSITPNSALGGSNVVVNITNNGNNTQTTASSRQEGGATVIDVLVEQVESAMGGRIARGNGLAPVLEQKYRLNPAAGAM